jgi:hypothetical protein
MVEPHIAQRAFKRTDVSDFVNRRRAGRLVGLAEREGFEPSVPRKRDNGFRDRPVRPLRHLSTIAQFEQPRAQHGGQR